VVLLDAEAHFEHVQVIRSDIKLESVKKCRDVENGPIPEKSEDFSDTAIFS
jgi:hypothetical protein